MTDFDKASRRMAKLRPLALLPVVLTDFAQHFRYRGWLDARTITWPGAPERTGDLVALLEALDEPGPPWAFAVEFASQPNPDQFGWLLVFLGLVWLEKRPDTLPGSRYQLAGAVLNLTGTSQSLPASHDMVLPGPDGLRCCLKVREIHLRAWSAEATLERISSGQFDSLVLAWIPVMTAQDPEAVERLWLELWSKEPDESLRRELVGAAGTLADLGEHRERWQHLLEGLGMMKSPLLESARQEGRLQERLQMLQELLSEKFGPLPSKAVERLQALPPDQLKALGRRLMHANTLADLGLE